MGRYILKLNRQPLRTSWTWQEGRRGGYEGRDQGWENFLSKFSLFQGSLASFFNNNFYSSHDHDTHNLKYNIVCLYIFTIYFWLNAYILFIFYSNIFFNKFYVCYSFSQTFNAWYNDLELAFLQQLSTGPTYSFKMKTFFTFHEHFPSRKPNFPDPNLFSFKI